MRAPKSIALLASIVLVLGGCSGMGRSINQALPEFLRSDPGADEIERYQTRVRVLNRSEEDERIASAAFEEVRAVYESGDWNDAADELEDYLKDYPDTKDDKEARWLLIQAHRQDDAADDCARAINGFIDRYPISAYNDRIEDVAFELATEMVEGEHDGLLYSEQETGIALFEKLVISFPTGRHAAASFWRVGNFYFDELRFAEAEAAYGKVVESYPDSEWTARSQFNRGLSLYRAIKGVVYDERIKRRAIEEFENYLAKYPEGDRRAEAQSFVVEVREMLCEREVAIGTWYDDQGFPRAARYYLKRAQALYPQTEAAKAVPALLAELPSDVLDEVDVPPPSEAEKKVRDAVEEGVEKAEEIQAETLPKTGGGS
jgi:outer membrane assembly lipoprotein YfiO